MIKLKLKRKNKEINFKLKLKSRVYTDSIFEVAPIALTSADTLQVSYDLDICGYTNDKLTSTIHEKFCYTFDMDKDMVVEFIRFTKFRRRASIQVYEKLPKDFYIPKKFNAKKIR